MENSKTNDLPYLQHFQGDSAIGKAADSFRKGEWTLFTLIKIALLGATLYFSWLYVLPVVFKAIGQVLAIAGTGIVILALVFMMPVIMKGIRRFTRFLHKLMIKHDPFAELEDQEKILHQKKKKFVTSVGKIDKLKNNAKNSSADSEKEAKRIESEITRLHNKAEKFKVEIETELGKQGDKFKESDDYINLRTEFRKVVANAERLGHKLSQEKVFVRKYGARHVVMKKMSQKLKWIGSDMDIKILDFRATIEILKREYEFAKESRVASSEAKDAMYFTNGWEVEYALDLVTSTIAADLAITTANFNDIDNITSLPMDSDEMYEKLDELANSIKTGDDPVPSAKAYTREDYKPTYEDKQASGFDDEMF
jgi:biopolymer transport protein ExbB/TolQ